MEVFENSLQVVRTLGFRVSRRRIALGRLLRHCQLAVGSIKRRTCLLSTHALSHRLGFPVVARGASTLELSARFSERLLSLQRLARGFLSHRVEFPRGALCLRIRGQHLVL